jgi:hypothetical protein
MPLSKIPNNMQAALTDAQMPAGAVLQVVESVRTIWTSTATTHFVSTGLSVVITPSATSSKIVLMGNMNGTYTSVATAYHQFKLYRNASDHGWISSNYGQENSSISGNYTSNYGQSLSWSWLDSPSSTSAQTYELFFRTPAGGTVGYNNYDANGNNTTRSGIIAWEIAV